MGKKVLLFPWLPQAELRSERTAKFKPPFLRPLSLLRLVELVSKHHLTFQSHVHGI